MEMETQPTCYVMFFFFFSVLTLDKFFIWFLFYTEGSLHMIFLLDSLCLILGGERSLHQIITRYPENWAVFVFSKQWSSVRFSVQLLSCVTNWAVKRHSVFVRCVNFNTYQHIQSRFNSTDASVCFHAHSHPDQARTTWREWKLLTEVFWVFISSDCVC